MYVPKVGNNEQMSKELHITFCTICLNLLTNLLFVIQLDVLLIYNEFDNKSQKSTLIHISKVFLDLYVIFHFIILLIIHFFFFVRFFSIVSNCL